MRRCNQLWIKGGAEAACITKQSKSKAMETKSLHRLLRLSLLFACLVAATTLPNLEADHLPDGRSKRRAEASSSSVLQYMEKLRNSLSDEQGKPTLAHSDDPTEVWGIQDVDILNDGYRRKPRSSQRCTTMNEYFFRWKTLSESQYSRSLPVGKATLRAYTKVIRRLLNQNSPTPVTAEVFMNSGTLNSTSLGVHAGSFQLSVTEQSASWVEVDVTEGVRNLWPPRSDQTHVKITVLFRSNKCKVPVMFEDPTTIPLDQTKRRKRLYALQPLFLVFLSDEKVKETIRNETIASGEDAGVNDDVGAAAGSSSERRKRDATEPCGIEDFKVVFEDLEINYVYSPYAYNARQCRGSCSHNTLGSRGHLANNHAKIMASAESVAKREPDTFLQDPKGPCCVPTKYSALTLVIPQADRSIQFVLYSHMIVDECKCR